MAKIKHIAIATQDADKNRKVLHRSIRLASKRQDRQSGRALGFASLRFCWYLEVDPDNLCSCRYGEMHGLWFEHMRLVSFAA